MIELEAWHLGLLLLVNGAASFTIGFLWGYGFLYAKAEYEPD